MKPLTDSCAATLLGHMSCQNCMSAVPRALRVQILYRSPWYYYCFGSHPSLFVLCVCLSDTRLLCRCAQCVTRGGWTGHHVMMTISMLWWWARRVFNLTKTSKKLVIIIHFTAELVSCQFNTGWVTRGHFDCYIGIFSFVENLVRPPDPLWLCPLSRLCSLYLCLLILKCQLIIVTITWLHPPSSDMWHHYPKAPKGTCSWARLNLVISGVARISLLLGHSMGTLRLYELPCEVQSL